MNIRFAYICINHNSYSMQPEISVIIPSYKPGEYITDCLDSLAAQTYSKNLFEVIVILNGCDEPWKSDLTALLDRLRLEHGLNGILIHSDLGNVSNARNLGLEKAQGNYICFIDDDDYVSDSYLEKLIEKADKDTVSLCHPTAFRDKGHRIAYSIENEYLRRKPFGKQPFYKTRKFFQGACLKLIHRDIIAGRRFDPSFINGEDSIFMFLISDRIKWVDFTTEDAVYYRRVRPESAHFSVNNNFRKRSKAAFKKMRMFTKYYFRAPFRYNLRFYLTRLMACVKNIIHK